MPNSAYHLRHQNPHQTYPVRSGASTMLTTPEPSLATRLCCTIEHIPQDTGDQLGEWASTFEIPPVRDTALLAPVSKPHCASFCRSYRRLGWGWSLNLNPLTAGPVVLRFHLTVTPFHPRLQPPGWIVAHLAGSQFGNSVCGGMAQSDTHVLVPCTGVPLAADSIMYLCGEVSRTAF